MIYPVKMDFLMEFPYVLAKGERIQFLAIAYIGDVIMETYSELFQIITELSECEDKSNISYIMGNSGTCG